MMAGILLAFAAGAATALLYGFVWHQEPELTRDLRAALKSQTVLAVQYASANALLHADLEAAERERDAWRAVANNLGQVLTLHASECPTDADTKDALERAYATQTDAHGVGPRGAELPV